MSDSEILEELKRLTKIVTLANGINITKEIEKIATSDDRKKIWVLIDGENRSEDIAKIIKNTERSVNRFLNILEQVEFIKKRHYGAPPKKLVEYTPSEWVELLDEKLKNKK